MTEDELGKVTRNATVRPARAELTARFDEKMKSCLSFARLVMRLALALISEQSVSGPSICCKKPSPQRIVRLC